MIRSFSCLRALDNLLMIPQIVANAVPTARGTVIPAPVPEIHPLATVA